MSDLKRFWPAYIVLLFVGTICGGALFGLLGADTFDTSTLSSKRTWRVIRFSFIQASLSTILSLALGVMLAVTLHRRRFVGKTAVLSFLSASFVLPPLVVVTGIIGVFGRSGWLSQLSEMIFGIGFNQWLYGLLGILIAHVFFNAAFSARALLGMLDAVPTTQWRNARQLSFTPAATWRLIDWPAIRPALPGLSVLIFLLTFTSFSIVLTLGGGPKSSTLEVAIYEALKFDFDIGKAVALSLIQICIGLCFLTFASLTKFPWPTTSTPTTHPQRPDRSFLSTRLLDILTVSVCIVVLALPTLALIIDGLGQVLTGAGLDMHLLKASFTSIGIAVAAASVCVCVALAVSLSQREALATLRRSANPFTNIIANVSNQAATIVLIIPVFVLSTGLFLTLRAFMPIDQLTLPLLVLINALMALPFASSQLTPALISAANANDRNCLTLGLKGWNRFTRIDLPLIRPALARATAYALALSLGDLGIIALFGSQNTQTLPFLLFQRMGSYRFGEAMATAFVLVCLVISIFLITDLLGRKHPEKVANA